MEDRLNNEVFIIHAKTVRAAKLEPRRMFVYVRLLLTFGPGPVLLNLFDHGQARRRRNIFPQLTKTYSRTTYQ
jgi:hypothetical protein